MNTLNNIYDYFTNPIYKNIDNAIFPQSPTTQHKIMNDNFKTIFTGKMDAIAERLTGNAGSKELSDKNWAHLTNKQLQFTDKQTVDMAKKIITDGISNLSKGLTETDDLPKDQKKAILDQLNATQAELNKDLDILADSITKVEQQNKRDTAQKQLQAVITFAYNSQLNPPNVFGFVLPYLQTSLSPSDHTTLSNIRDKGKPYTSDWEIKHDIEKACKLIEKGMTQATWDDGIWNYVTSKEGLHTVPLKLQSAIDSLRKIQL